jgi:hypothetical protein
MDYYRAAVGLGGVWLFYARTLPARLLLPPTTPASRLSSMDANKPAPHHGVAAEPSGVQTKVVVGFGVVLLVMGAVAWC